MHVEKFMAHIRGGDEIGDLQLILLNKQQLVCGANAFLFKTPYTRYSYCEDNEVTFLWKQLSALHITFDIRGAWKPTLKNSQDMFLMEAFIDKGYNSAVLAVLNDIRVYMKVVVLSDIKKEWKQNGKLGLGGKTK